MVEIAPVVVGISGGTIGGAYLAERLTRNKTPQISLIAMFVLATSFGIAGGMLMDKLTEKK